jgi:RNA polymerase sigma-70 factor (ECF subfamily)
LHTFLAAHLPLQNGAGTMAPHESPHSSGPYATSWDLLRLARQGDRDALDALFARHVPILRRFAHGRLPRWTRGIVETGDLVQDVVLKAFRRLDALDARRKGALQAYLRQAILNRIRDEHRTFARRPGHDPLDDDAADGQASPFDQAVDAETARRYAKALGALGQQDRELIVGRIELGYSYEQLAMAAGRPTAGSARLAVRRALLRLGDAMQRG